MSQSPPNSNQKRQTRYARKDNFPSMATPKTPEPKKKGGFLGMIFFLGIVGGLAWLVMLIFNLGPYKSDQLQSTETLAVTPEIPLVVDDPFAADTLAPIFTVTLVQPNTKTLIPTETVTPTPTSELRPFILYGEPEAMTSDLIRPQLGCGYLVIAGQVWDLQGSSVTEGARIHLFGTLGDYQIDAYSDPGSALVYGESGYEFALEGLVIDSLYELQIQLEDDAGQPLSVVYYIQTYEDCQRNLILVNFKKVR
jgi:hypothetical protein